MRSYYHIIIVVALVALSSCSRSDEGLSSASRATLAVDVRMVNSDWVSRSADPEAVGSVVDVDDNLEIVAMSEPMESEPQGPISRGAPIASTTSLSSLGISLFRGATFLNTLNGTNSAGAWALTNNTALDLGANTYSYYAYSPKANEASNGVKIGADYKSLIYTAPTTISAQPDLCRAAPITNDNTGKATFVMSHALTAVGVKVCADSVEIEYIKLVQVNTSGTLNLTSGAWSSLGTPGDMTFGLSKQKLNTGGNVADITASNGYVMLPPQSLNVDDKKLEIKYRYTSGADKAWKVSSHNLNTLSDKWSAGQKAIYVIQLKSTFALTLDKEATAVRKEAGTYTITYNTDSPASLTLDPKVSCPDEGSWITNIKVNRSQGSGTITFNYSANSVSAPRKTTFTVTSGFTTKKFVLTQIEDLWIRLSTNVATGIVPPTGAKYTVTVSTPVGVPWMVTYSKNALANIENGDNGASVIINTLKNDSPIHTVEVEFRTNLEGVAIESQEKVTWTGTQIPLGYVTTASDGIGLPAGMMYVGHFGGYVDYTTKYTKGLFIDKRGHMDTEVNMGTTDDAILASWDYYNKEAPQSSENEYDGLGNTNAMTDSQVIFYCKRKGMYLPAADQISKGLFAASASKWITGEYTFRKDTEAYYWSSTQSGLTDATALNIYNAIEKYTYKSRQHYFRCVMEK